ncbi:hypothetical protein TTRE_0000139901 [Trichuris trichiura]|uniref:Uncharacterized protein n=1 Tax=Trichuris trichiura TaxID=36087 RepID=A0A077YZB6_TRITR|nr:hypothetical protein TTRE_0000139901 [Trichuris trichiura]
MSSFCEKMSELHRFDQSTPTFIVRKWLARKCLDLMTIQIGKSFFLFNSHCDCWQLSSCFSLVYADRKQNGSFYKNLLADLGTKDSDSSHILFDCLIIRGTLKGSVHVAERLVALRYIISEDGISTMPPHRSGRALKKWKSDKPLLTVAEWVLDSSMNNGESGCNGETTWLLQALTRCPFANRVK